MAELATAGMHVLVDVPITFAPENGTTVHSPMDGPASLFGRDVLRGTALIASADTDRGVVWLVPRDVGIRVGHERSRAPSDS